MTYLKIVFSFIGAIVSGTLFAHATISPNEVYQGTNQKITLNIPHGCSGSPTKEIIVFVPDELQGAKPMVKPGWVIEIERKNLSNPYVSHGREITSDVRKITWRGGPLSNDHFDEFSMRVKINGSPGKYPIVVHQICEVGRWEWSEFPNDNKQSKSPAPVLKILKN
jgi:periplasmic copper chaperone A